MACSSPSAASIQPGPTGKKICGAVTSNTACPACGCTRPIMDTRSITPNSRGCSATRRKRGLLVQIVLRMEDERVHHPAIDVPRVNASPLVDVLKKVPQAKVQLINSAGPLLGNNVSALVRETQVTFDIAATEGNGGVGRLIEGKNPSYRGAIPVERLLFGSHAPYFPVRKRPAEAVRVAAQPRATGAS